jgi:molecular chaperone GrpE
VNRSRRGRRQVAAHIVLEEIETRIMSDTKHRHRGGHHADDQKQQPDPGANGQVKDDARAEAPGEQAGGSQPDAEAQPGPAEAAATAAAETGAQGGDELGALRDRHLRLAAEFDNYRKRVERERGEAFVRAQAQLMERLVEPLDDLQRIADFDPATTPATALHEGAEMVEKKFLRVMEAAGLETIDAEGKAFDPTVHEALTTVPTDVAEEDDTVAQVYQKGYRFKGVLLRPARVVVRKHQG